MQFHDPFPFGNPSSSGAGVLERPRSSAKPFGVRHAVDVPADPAVTAEAERAHYDPDRQISMLRVGGIDVPMMKRGSGQTSTTTNQSDRQAPDDDTDVGSNG
ncbi:putative ATP-grasp target RiPP [Spinactinospora alkalitolerans]|uniref:Putative ATP-grasp target RiPP n=1 Tax=Spinactinospora alkalitolerans TaxID=687207 RepID=A0A852TPZ1_9ACTN|nr:putative ATP-grasp-modified RiPP [Spinactinospora alkalitolerans]NYE45571.1 putative ATP-grasp target RiPP [Spinactinospora alkalitolerans]